MGYLIFAVLFTAVAMAFWLVVLHGAAPDPDEEMLGQEINPWSR